MSERKVLNKYYPPDFDPSKIPKLRQAKNRTFGIRLMAPFNMRCNTCGEYIYKGKKFNSRKETVDNENYLGLHIFRFYIKCPRCIAEIAFKTDPVNTDYVLEAGATRNFEALRTAELQAVREQKEKEDEEANNPMKLLENRTKASQNEMEMLETLEDLRELRQRHKNVDTNVLFDRQQKYEEQLLQLMEEEDEEEIRGIYRNSIKRLPDVDEEEAPAQKAAKVDSGRPTDVLVQNEPSSKTSKNFFSPALSDLSSLVRPKTKSTTDKVKESSCTAPVASMSTSKESSCIAPVASMSTSKKSSCTASVPSTSSSTPSTITTSQTSASMSAAPSMLVQYSDSGEDSETSDG